ncbi:MAG: glutamine synthetase family protein [Microthrixaceae bacterium]|nr:glutamine synthetase family protein [Microthrixaceae bacterium]
MLNVEELTELVATGEVDTVVVAFADMQGRLVGKRVVAEHFVAELPRNGAAVECCDYLLAVDVDMVVLEGFRFSSWETGYGDFECRPDLSTLRLVPWLERTAMVLGDLFDHDGELVEVAPRSILRRQLERAGELGYEARFGTELEFFLFCESAEEARAKGFRDLTPSSPYIIDYHLLGTTRDEAVISKLRSGMLAAGLPVENSKGEAGRGQHELNLRFADALTMADNHAVYKNGAREIAWLEDRCLTFMAKPAFDDAGSSCHIHSSLWDTANGRSVMASQDDGNAPSEVFRWFLGGLLATAAELSLCFAPFVNSYKRYQPGSWAPTAIGWDTDNRTLGFRVVGHGQAMRVESRVPGSDCNPYVAEAAMLAGGLHGIQNRIEPPEPTKGNGYESDLPRIPSTLVEAIELFDGSEVARSAFGEEAHFHLLHMAREEWAAFNRTVTDWELRRNFEQL